MSFELYVQFVENNNTRIFMNSSTNVNKFAISSHTALILGIRSL